MIRTFLTSLIMSSFTLLYAQQDRDPHLIVEQVENEFKKVRDFTARAEIKVDVDFIKIPEKNATVYFKYPDKYRFKSKGFIMIPKKGLNFSITEVLSQPATVVYGGEKEIEDENCYNIKIIPDDPKSEIVLANLFIDPGTHFVREMEANTRKSGSYVLTLFYSQTEYPLPSRIIIKFDVEKLHFPLKFMGDIKIEDSRDSILNSAIVTILYSDYKINTDLKDEIFREDIDQQ